MSKVKVVFWSGTGNTQAMADAVANGITGAGGEAEVTTFDAISAADAAKDTVIAFGCPAMGAEVLEETTVELPEGEWNICINGIDTDEKSLGTAKGNLKVSPVSAVVLTKKESHSLISIIRSWIKL